MLVDTKKVFTNIFSFIIKINFFLGRIREVKIMGRLKEVYEEIKDVMSYDGFQRKYKLRRIPSIWCILL